MHCRATVDFTVLKLCHLQFLLFWIEELKLSKSSSVSVLLSVLVNQMLPAFSSAEEPVI